MGLVVLSAPALETLATVERVKDELGITDSASDETLERILVRASGAITRECGRTSFGVGEYSETVEPSGSQRLGLLNVPILAVTQVLQDTDVLPTLAADDEDGYSVDDAEAGALYRPSGWAQSAGLRRWGAEALGSRYILPGGTGTLRYTVTYWAGYTLPAQNEDPSAPVLPTLPLGATTPPPLPGALEQACLLTAKAWWLARDREPDSVLSEQRIGARSWTYARASGAGALGAGAAAAGALPAAALQLLRDYRRVC